MSYGGDLGVGTVVKWIAIVRHGSLLLTFGFIVDSDGFTRTMENINKSSVHADSILEPLDVPSHRHV